MIDYLLGVRKFSFTKEDMREELKISKKTFENYFNTLIKWELIEKNGNGYKTNERHQFFKQISDIDWYICKQAANGAKII